MIVERAQAMPADVGGEMLDALRRSEERYARAMEASGDGYTDWIVATDEFYASPSLLEMYGLPPDAKFAGRSDFVARFPIHPEDRDRIVEAVNAQYAGTSARFELDMRVLRRGETRWMRAVFLCSRDASGALVRVSTAIKDVTDRKIAEDELRLRKEELQRLMESVSDYLWSAEVGVDGSYNYRYYSPVVERITGWPAEKLLESRERWVELLHPLDRQRVDETFRQLMSGATEQVEVEYRIVPPDGTLRWVRDSAHGTRVEDGRILLYGVVSDITQRKRAEDERREHLWFLESMDRINRAMHRSNDVELMTSGVVQEALEIFACDRVALVYPCDPETPVYHTAMEHVSPQYTGALTLGIDLPASPEGAELNRRCLHDPGVVVNPRLPPAIHERFCIASMLTIAVRPKNDHTYRFTVQCMRSRSWTAVELRLFEEIARRMEDALTSVVAYRNLLASQEALQVLSRDLQESKAKLEEAQRITHVGYWEWDLLTGRVNWSDETYRIYGLQPQERPMDIAACQERIHPEDWQRGMEEALGGGRFKAECRLFRPTGEVRIANFQGDVKRDASGRPYRMFGTVQDITERKLGAEALRKSEARFRALTELSSDWYWEQDENLRFTYLSSQADHSAGYPGRFSIGKTRWELEGLTPLSSSWAEHQAALAARQPFRDFEYSRVALDGTIRYVSVSGAPVFDEQGRFKGYQGIARNITERKRIEEELRESEQKYRTLFDSIDEGFCTIEVLFDENVKPVDYCFVQINPSFERQTGIKNAVGRRMREIAPEHEEHWFDIYGKIALTGEPMRFENEAKQLGRWYDVYAFRVEDPKFRRVGILFKDITERRRAEEELRARQDMLDLAQKAARAVAFEWRRDATAPASEWPVSWSVGVSAELEGLLGVAPGSFDGTFESWKKLVHPGDWPSVEQSLALAGETGEMSSEYRVVNSGAAPRWLQSKGRVLFDARGEPERLVGFVLDVTEKHKAEDELRRLEKQLRLAQRLEAMGTLAGGIAHDFNNILGAILGYGEMALRSAPKGSRLHRDLDSIMTAGERGRALVDRVLAFSRNGLGERVAVHVETIVREALELLEAKLPEAIRVEAKLRAGRAAILGDATQVHQVLMNLGTNAVQAMPAGGTLYVSLDTVRSEVGRSATIGGVEAGEYVVLTVGDTGTGIARDMVERIFDPFFTTKEVGTGTGLGLSLVHGTVTELGGAIDVTSTPGQGSEFTVYLPRSGEAVEAGEGEAAAIPRGDGQQVLIVDDEEPLASLCTRTLEELGYVPTGFTSSSAALAAFRADPKRFDAVITDERMPGMTGSALIKALRTDRRDLPILLMSGFVGGGVASRAREAGADEVLKKPLSKRDLATSLARVLRR